MVDQQPMAPEPARPAGAADSVVYVAGLFAEPHEFKEICQASMDAGHREQEVHCPWPIHGLEHVLGYGRSWIGRPVLAALLGGAALGFLMQYWMMKVDWPIIIGGKPYNSWPAYVVITFEMGVLSGALLNFFLCLAVACRIRPEPNTAVIDPAVTDDKFCLALPSAGNGSSEAAWLQAHGAESIFRYQHGREEAPAVADDLPSEAAHV